MSEPATPAGLRTGPAEPVPVAVARRRVLALLDAPPPLLIVADFDGTLAPIVTEPGAARILPLGRSALRLLARVAEVRPDRLALAVLSGRTAHDVAARVRVGGLRYFGSHGMETGVLPRRVAAGRLAVGIPPALARRVPAVEALAAEVARRLADAPWLYVEPKGPSVGFHYRTATDPDGAREAILAALDGAEATLGVEGLARLESRRVVELRPVDAAGKGSTLAALIDELAPGAVLVLGDDRTDAEAFAVVRERRADRHRPIAGLAVGVHGAAETPAEVRATADLLVAGPREAARVLAALARSLAREAGLA